MDGIQIQPAAVHAADKAFAELARELIGAVPDPRENTADAYMVWTRLEAACQVAAAETLGGVPPHLVDWERIALILGVAEAEARAAWRLEPHHPDHHDQTP
jgi:hypothetical protein